MAVFPNYERGVLDIYECPICGGIYRRGRGDMSCCVLHGPGSCCHYSDIKVTQVELDKVRKIFEISI